MMYVFFVSFVETFRNRDDFLAGCLCVLVILKFCVEGKQYCTRPETPNTYKNTPVPRQKSENMQRLRHIIDILAEIAAILQVLQN